MSFSSWRQFQFYDVTPIKDPQTGTSSLLYSDPTISAAASLGPNKLVIAVQSKVIKIIGLGELKLKYQFTAYADEFQISYLYAISENFLVSVGENLGSPSVIKLWKLDKCPRDAFDFHAAIEIKNEKNTFPISAVSISQDATCLVIGFANGRIILVRGDLLRDRGSKQRVIYEDSNKEPITSLYLDSTSNICFASTTSSIFVLATNGRNNGLPETVLNSKSGVDLNCSSLNFDDTELVCATSESLEFYKPNGERRSLVVDIPLRRRIQVIDQSRLLVISGTEAPNSAALNIDGLVSSNNRALVLDVRNKFVTMTTLISGNVLDVFTGEVGGITSLYILSSNGELYKLQEKSVDEKLHILEQKQLYEIALELAKQQDIDETKMQSIRKEYAGHLYENGSRSASVDQYIQCIPITEISEVIAKFGTENTTSISDVRNLSRYLKAVIRRNLGNPDHVTLYLICLIKLKDEDSIEDFISHFSRNGKLMDEAEPESSWNTNDDAYFFSDKILFDLDLVLRMLTESNLLNESYKLARKFSKDPIVVVETVLGNLRDAHRALLYVKSLAVDDALRVLIKYSKHLLQVLPNDTNALLIELFTGRYKPNAYNDSNHKECSSDDLVKDVFYSYSTFVRGMLSSSGDVNGPEVDHPSTYQPPKPALIFPSFIGHSFEFVVFLEACLESYNKFDALPNDKQVVLTTLYDTYLSLTLEDKEERQKEWKEKASKVFKESQKLVSDSKILQGGDKLRATSGVDNSLMKLISHVNQLSLRQNSTSDDEGEFELEFDETMNFADTFRSNLLSRSPQYCMFFLEKYGDKEPSLYVMALYHFISSKSVFQGIGGETVYRQKILDKVLELNLIPILEILQILASTSVATMSLVKDLLITHIQQENQEIKNNEKLIESYKADLAEKRGILAQLSEADEGQSKIQMKDKICNLCQTVINLPLVYFKCGHIFHQNCLNEETSLEEGDKLYRCPICVVNLKTTEGLIANREEVKRNTQLLEIGLASKQNSRDRFRVVAEFIGKGTLEPSGMIFDDDLR
ncbi:LAMI_0C05094g1_1 [Lachancea mirantina]|uniref:E3 ubiquitin-protein ligase PEP5 n=1 Tax=Lachancea mirantina TaxID=1230905 RepID=A0A1G4J2E5_9SACH|nr:LAMI_0C05094g1_1 [Lachancea mirantina]